MMVKAAIPAESSRHASMRAVMESVVEAGAISRASIARATGLSKQTISDAVRELEKQGWLRAAGRARGGLGRSAVNYEICPEGAFVFGCDLGGTKLHIALSDLAGTIVAEAIEQTEQRSGRHLLNQIRATADKVARKAKIDRRRVQFAAIGMPGVIDPQSGALALSPNMPDFAGINVLEGMRQAFGCAVSVENDVNLGVLGEHWRGQGRGIANLVFIALGTGIGMGLMADGSLVRGAHGAASEIGYLPIGADPFDRRNVEAGTFEAVVGTGGILRRHREAGGKVTDGVRGIFDAMLKGDLIARRTIEETARWTAIGIASVVALVDPEMVILGGGIGTRAEFIALVQENLGRCLLKPVPVAASPLGNRATLMGALALGLTQVYGNVFGVRAFPSAKQEAA